ncbi:MAG: MFS transporter [Bacillaceae bacterium]|nr:MFS transporter [Bacillaceae bacterium]
MSQEQSGNSVKKGLAVILALSSVPLIMVLGNSMLIPVLPKMKSVLDVTEFQVSLVITLFSVPAGIVIPIAGILSDRIGRKKVIIPSLILYGLGGVFAAVFILLLEDPYYWVLTGRILQGIGAAGTAPIVMALVSDIYTRQERSKALGIIESSNAMGKVLSPILGSLIALITWYSVFFAFPVLTFLSALGIWLLVKEPPLKGDKVPLSQYAQDLKRVWKRQGKWLSVAFLAGAVTLFILFGVLFYLSEILEKTYKIEGVKKGLVLAIPLLALTISAYWTGTFIQKRKHLMKTLIVIGLFSLGLVSGIVPFVDNNILLIGLLVISGISSGFILPCLNTMITSAVGSKERGIITSLYGSVRFLGVAAGPPVFGAMMERINWLFWGIAVLAVINAILALFFIHRPREIKGKKGHSRVILRPHPAGHRIK